MIDLARSYLQRGWKPIPVPYKSKGPILDGWQNLRLTESDLPSYFRGRNNIGVLLGEPSGWLIDIDLDHPLAVELAPQFLPATGAMFGRENNPRSHWLYTSITPVETYKRTNKKLSKKTIAELRSTGLQTVFPGSVHESGELVEWVENNEPLRIDPGELVVYFDNLCDEVERRMGVFQQDGCEQPPDVSKAQIYNGNGLGDERLGDEYNRTANVEALLKNNNWSKISQNDNCSHWRRPGKTTGVSASLRSDNTFCCFTTSTDLPDYYNTGKGLSPFALLAYLEHSGDFEAAAKSLSKSIGKERIRAASNAASKEREDKESANGVNLSGFMTQAPEQPKPEKKEIEPFPKSLYEIEGIIGEFVKYATETAPRPRPELALAAAISLMGVITGRKIRNSSNMRTNIYVMGLAASGSGKEWARGCMQNVLAAAGLDNMLAPENPASESGLITAISEHPASVFLIDEVHRYLSTIRAAGDKSSHLSGIFSVLMKVYGQASNKCWRPKGYGDSKNNKSVAFPHCCMYGTGTPDGFWGSVKSSDAVDGFLARFMIIEASNEYPRLRDVIYQEPPESLVAKVREWGDFIPAQSGMFASINYDAMCVPFERTAETRLREHSDSIEDRLQNEPDEMKAIWGRASATAKKIAMIFAASRGASELIVCKEDADAAIKLVNWSTRLLLKRVFTHICESDSESKKKRTLEVIRKHSPIRWRDLTRKTQGWIKDEKEREAIVLELVLSEYVAYEEPPAEAKVKNSKGLLRILE